MKLFFLGWSGKDLGVVAAMKNLKQAGHEIVYCTCSNLDKEIDRADFPGTIFQEHLAAEEGIPAPALSNEKFDPPGEELLGKLLEAESTVMTMMNKHFERMSISERKNLYFNYVGYWNGVIKKYRPEAMVFLATPHNNYDFVIYSLAKLFGIKTIMLEAIWVNDRVLIMEDLEKGSASFLKYQNQDFDFELLSQDLKDFYRWQIDKEKDPIPFYVNDTWKRFSGLNFLKLKSRIFYKSAKDLSIFKKSYFFLKKRLGKNPIKEYQQVQSEPDFSEGTHSQNSFGRDTSQFWAAPEATTKVYPLDTPRRSDAVIARNWLYPFGLRRFFRSASLLLGKVSKDTISSSRLAESKKSLATRPEPILRMGSKFVYLPLHYQPERATSPQGGIFTDQILMVEMLAASLPVGWQLYVKEHPVQWLVRGPTYFNCRFPGYYQMLASIKNVKLIPVSTNSFTLIKKCQAVATVTGTPGWEAVFKLKPVLAFGYPWYQYCKGIFRVFDVRSCRKALEEISGGLILEKQGIINFLGALEQVTFHGYLEEAGKGISALTPKENGAAIANAIASLLL